MTRHEDVVSSDFDGRVHRVVDSVLDEMADNGQLEEIAETRDGVRALATGAVSDSDDYRKLRDNTLKLAASRVEAAQNGDGKPIEDTTLFRLFGLVAKLDLEVARRIQEMPSRSRVENVLMIVRQDGLPVDRQAELLVRAFREVGGDEYRRALVELVGPEEAQTRLALEEGDSP